MYEGFHCGEKSVVWDSDFDAEDYGYSFKGIVHECHCSNCGAEITYVINLEENDEATEAERQEAAREEP